MKNKQKTLSIYFCLNKTRLTSPFRELADDFTISISYANKIFFKNIQVIAGVLRPFILTVDKESTKCSWLLGINFIKQVA